jgi:hypothetical protein
LLLLLFISTPHLVFVELSASSEDHHFDSTVGTPDEKKNWTKSLKGFNFKDAKEKLTRAKKQKETSGSASKVRSTTPSDDV